MNTTREDGRKSLADRLVRGPAGFRDLLQRLGPTFIKLGQFLALRPDLVPQEYCDELMGLLDQVPSFPWEQARASLREDFGREPTEIFSFINPRPLAAGSLAQAHLARTKDGQEVAVKIQRPQIRGRVLKDLRRTKVLARLLQMSGFSLISSPQELFQELTTWMMQEIDLNHELANLTRLYQLTLNSPYERVPKPYPDLSSARVLTAEFLSGVPVSEILIALRSGRPEELERVKNFGADWNQFAANLVRSTLGQIFRYQFFHADLHPGNLLVLPGSVVGYVDFALCDELDETLRKDQLRYITAVYSGDLEQMFKALTQILIPGERTDIEGLRMEFMAETRTWLGKSANNGIDGVNKRSQMERSPIAQWMVGIMRATRRHGFKVPTQILSMYRALLTAESVAASLAPELDVRAVGQEFFSALAVEEAFHSLDPAKLQPILLNMLALGQDLPGQLRQILADLTEGRLTVKVDVSETQTTARTRSRRVRLLVTSILSLGIAVLITQAQLPRVFGISLCWPLYGVLVLIYISTYFQWRRLR